MYLQATCRIIETSTVSVGIIRRDSMAALAKQAMRMSLLKLLNEKPYHQITVKEIVEDCDLNRNTFYYHFHDLNELLESTMDASVQQIVRAHPTLDSIKDCFDALVEFVLDNRYAMLHLYHSQQRQMMERYLWHIDEYLITTYLSQLSYFHVLEKDEQALLIDYFNAVFFGMSMHWLENGLDTDVHTRLRRLLTIRQHIFTHQVSLHNENNNKII